MTVRCSRLVAQCGFALLFSFLGLSCFPQEALDADRCRKLVTSSQKGLYLTGVLSDRGTVDLYEISLDLEGRGLPGSSKERLLEGYSVTGTDRDGHLHPGSIRVLSDYAWADSDFHTWVAYIPGNSNLLRVSIGKGLSAKSFPISSHYGNNARVRDLRIDSEGTLDWRTELEKCELFVSGDSGATWRSYPTLRVPNGTQKLAPILPDNRGTLLILLQGYDKGTLLVNCYQFTRRK